MLDNGSYFWCVRPVVLHVNLLPWLVFVREMLAPKPTVSSESNFHGSFKPPWTRLPTSVNLLNVLKPDGVILASMVLKLVSSSDAANTDVTDAPSSSSSQPQGQVGETIGEVGGPFF